MSKKLNEMTLEELWHLFPIFLVEHKPIWRQWYEEEVMNLSSIFSSNNILRISHIGSTAIDGIWAKPIIDILVEINDSDFNDIINILINNNYLLMSQSDKRLSFNKGYTEYGFAEKVFHIHVRFVGDNDEIYFRDYLNFDSNIAKEYEKLKLSLWKKYEYDRDGYTNAKQDFIVKYTNMAKDKFKDRYL